MQQDVQQQINQTEEPVTVEAETGVLNVEAEECTDSKTDAMAALAMTIIILLAVVLWLQGL